MGDDAFVCQKEEPLPGDGVHRYVWLGEPKYARTPGASSPWTVSYLKLHGVKAGLGLSSKGGQAWELDEPGARVSVSRGDSLWGLESSPPT